MEFYEQNETLFAENSDFLLNWVVVNSSILWLSINEKSEPYKDNMPLKKIWLLSRNYYELIKFFNKLDRAFLVMIRAEFNDGKWTIEMRMMSGLENEKYLLIYVSHFPRLKALLHKFQQLMQVNQNNIFHHPRRNFTLPEALRF